MNILRSRRSNALVVRRGCVGLGVYELRLKVPQTVIAQVALRRNRPLMNRLAADRRWQDCHGLNSAVDLRRAR